MCSNYGGGDEYEDVTPDFYNPDEGFKGLQEVEQYVRGIAARRNITLARRNSDPYKVRFICSRGGNYRNQKMKNERNTKMQKLDCRFRIVAKQYDLFNDLWEIEVLEGKHNHPFPEHAEGSRLGQISRDEYKELQRLEALHTSPSNALAYMKQDNANNATDQKRVYNAYNKSRSNRRDGRTATNNFISLMLQRNYRYQLRTMDDSNVLKDIVFSHPASHAMVNAYPQVLIIDTTYKTSMYNMPLFEAVGATSTDKTFTIAYAYMQNESQDHFEFVLKFIRGLYERAVPNVVVTDRAFAMMGAVDQIFPESQHQLCRRHIEQCVLARAQKQQGFDASYAEYFKNRWNWAISASTHEVWIRKWAHLQKAYKRYPTLIAYCEDTWITPFEDRVLGAYIDHRLHYGNYTTNRVEQEHHRVKMNLPGGLHPFDVIFDRLHQVMELQICEIKTQVSHNTQKIRTDLLNVDFFSEIVHNVSFKAIDLILKEFGKDIGEKMCGCYLRRTHGLPCHCELLWYMSAQKNIPIACIDSYWRTLGINFPDIPTNNINNDDVGVNTQRKLFDDTEDVVAPPAVEKKNKTTRSTDRKPSMFERVSKIFGAKTPPTQKGKGRVAATNACQDIPLEARRKSTSEAHNTGNFVEGSNNRYTQGPKSCSHQNFPNNHTSKPPKSPASKNIPPRNNIAHQSRSHFEENFPPYIKDYIHSCTDVIGDGNCGFRAVALAIYGNENFWPRVRQDMLDELRKRREIYENIIYGITTEGLEALIDHFNYDFATRDKWFSMPDCGYLVATVYNIFVIAFSDYGAFLCPPIALDSCNPPPTARVVIGNVNGNTHWILLEMIPGDYPVAPISNFWHTNKHTSAAGLDLQFTASIRLYKRLQAEYEPERVRIFQAEKQKRQQKIY